MAIARRIIRLPELTRLIGRSRSSVYDILNPRSPRHISDFPRPVRLGNTTRCAIGWHQDEILTWLDSRQRTQPFSPLH
jgi:prophage regulatory protein